MIKTQLPTPKPAQPLARQRRCTGDAGSSAHLPIAVIEGRHGDASVAAVNAQAARPPEVAANPRTSRKPRKSPVSTRTLDEDAILARIENGESLAHVAASLGLDRSTLSKWLNADHHRSARAREARAASAAAFDEQAERDLRAATNPFELAKARDLAHHLRWRASKINPKAYGDKLEVAAGDGQLTLEERLKQINEMEVPAHAPMPPGAEWATTSRAPAVDDVQGGHAGGRALPGESQLLRSAERRIEDVPPVMSTHRNWRR